MWGRCRWRWEAAHPVVTGGQGYLETACLFSGSMRFNAEVQAQVLVPALAPSILQ